MSDETQEDVRESKRSVYVHSDEYTGGVVVSIFVTNMRKTYWYTLDERLCSVGDVL